MNLLKQLLSLVIPQTIYVTRSPLSGEIQILQHMGRRSLIVGGLVQSVSGNALNLGQRIWSRLVEETVNIAAGEGYKISSILLLGLGGGTMVGLFRKKLGPVPITAVEIDPIIVHLAHKYFGLDRADNLRTIVGNALDVVGHPETFNLDFPVYSLIVVDLYLGSVFPTFAQSIEFFTGLNNLLAERGIVVFNRTDEGVDFVSSVKAHFDHVNVVEVLTSEGSRNYLFIGRKKE